ncbi:MAG: acyl-CoA thioesterase, partial [Muribaculaceae bacterium]|nr:acyl-CoA thioesterase [Muribaculaceae bacterium]
MEVPAATIEFRHRLPVQLRFRDIDMFGHVNNNVYLELMDVAKAAF